MNGKWKVRYPYSGILLTCKNDKVPHTYYNINESWKLNREKSYKKPHSVWFRLHEMSRIDKFTGTEGGLVAARV